MYEVLSKLPLSELEAFSSVGSAWFLMFLWVSLLKSAGWSSEDMSRWHAVFERDYPEAHQDLDLLFDSHQRFESTLLQVVPSVLNELTLHPRFEELKSLRYLFAGGEALSVELAKKIKALGVSLINLYV